MISSRASFVVATPQRSVCDDHARALEQIGQLRLLALGTRRGTRGVPTERTRLNPAIGLLTYLAARLFSTYRAELIRFSLLPWFDSWLTRLLQPGDHLISSYGYANESFRLVRSRGGRTFLDAGNSHIDQFWELVSEEHRRWGCQLPPASPAWYQRSLRCLDHTDYILSPSRWVTESYLARGFTTDRILQNVYPLNLDAFRPTSEPRPADRPLTLVCTGQLSLRKGTPYLLEAMRLVLKHEPDARLLLTDNVADSVRPILPKYADLPISWAPPLPHADLAKRLRQADVFVLPSLEEGLVRTACEALACGLYAVLTPNTGANDFIVAGENGEVVPPRDPGAIAAAVLRCWEQIQQGTTPTVIDLHQRLSFERFAQTLIGQLEHLGLIQKPV